MAKRHDHRARRSDQSKEVTRVTIRIRVAGKFPLSNAEGPGGSGKQREESNVLLMKLVMSLSGEASLGSGKLLVEFLL